MSKRQLPRPTDAELAILGVLWDRSSATVREVFEVLSKHRRVGYTTVLKLMQIMTAKGLVQRDQEQRSHIYRAAVQQEVTQRQLLADLLDRAFGGSAQKLIMGALSARNASREELAQIRRQLEELENQP